MIEIMVRHCASEKFAIIPPIEEKMAKDSGGITELLQRWRTGDREVEERLFEVLMPDLRAIAARCFRGERSGHTLQPTALVNEAFFRLARAKNIDWQDRGHFFAIAAVMMRRLLIDHARRQPDAELLPIEGLPEGRLAMRRRWSRQSRSIRRSRSSAGSR